MFYKERVIQMKKAALLCIVPFLFNTTFLKTMNNPSPKISRLRPEERRIWDAPETRRLTAEEREKRIKDQNRRSPSPSRVLARCKEIFKRERRTVMNSDKLSDAVDQK